LATLPDFQEAKKINKNYAMMLALMIFIIALQQRNGNKLILRAYFMLTIGKS
jgi:hypothetical protein